jgi:hypothetical protein
MSQTKKTRGFVYILEVEDIVLPVCKIGMTTRSPQERCNEINNSSTGDFIWSVAHSIYVSDCQKLESLVHSKLKPLRQKRREFFNLSAEDGNKVLTSIFESQSKIKEIEYNNKNVAKPKESKNRRWSSPHTKPKHAEILQSFASLLKIKVRPFGQKNKPVFGVSDGKIVQWNLEIRSDTGNIKLGVNLEGSQKTGKWLIAPFILSELKNPTIEKLKTDLDTNLNDIIVRFSRDAWQAGYRLNIVEECLGGKEFFLSEIDTKLWISILNEALTCLDETETRKYKGSKKKQLVTLKKGNREVEKDISPHLTISIPINNDGNVVDNLENGFKKLRPIYNWVNEKCGIKNF